ncbi:hypothetical protein N9408_09640, partial [Opitutales bacterium]|nr:hypothetical protein [Opitutales bacterium]
KDRGDGSRNWKGDLGELLIFNTALSDSDIAKIEGYLAHKWGLTGSLASGHPYKNSAPLTNSHYVSSNPEILEINGTSALIRGGGTATITSYAPENATAFAATPVTKTISVAKAPLTITGQDLSLSVGDAIPDLNYTVTGWKHSDASAAMGANPLAMASLELWLDASDTSTITHTSNAVSKWADKSGNENNATQSTTANKPTLIGTGLNGKSVISFDGSDDRLDGSGLGSNSELTFFAVVKRDRNTLYDTVFAKSGSWASGVLHLINNAQRYNFTVNSGESLFSSSTTDGEWSIIAAKRTNSTASIGIDGGTPTTVSGTYPNADLSSFNIGYWNNNGSPQRHWLGSFAEFIVTSSSLSNSQSQAIEGYLAHKWGLSGSLPSNHSHKAVSFTKAPIVTTDATSSSSAGTYYVRPSGAQSKKYSFTYVDGDLVLSSLTAQEIAWGQDFSGVSVGQIVDLNASATSGLAVIYSVDDTSVAELAVTNQSSLQAWYKLDAFSGDATDSSANNYTGSLRNGPTYNTGKFGNAIVLDGADDYVQAFGFNGIGGNNRRTIALWFKTSTVNKPILQYGTAGTGTLFKLALNSSGAVVLDLGGTTITSSTTGLANGTWHHLAATLPADGKMEDARLYIDNTSNQVSSNTTAVNTATSSNLIIGRDGVSGSAYFNGQIDDVRFYAAELNATLVSRLYGNGNGDFNRLKINTAGTVTITANQPGDNTSYAPTPSVSLTTAFDKSNQSISFGSIDDKSVGDFDFIPMAVASSGLPVSFSSSDSLIAEVQPDGQTIKVRA